ncbi:C40 family peptidase [Nocardia paucivorans]|uniref:C40 family peptidase n=1 Tax=Nocardia paucivorans TaxID=114259 RepID=UPI00030A0A59|nr:NlpC/P60 family protein [Nocardia paucivorans]
MGAVAATTGTMPAIPAMAATTTIDIPGIGKFDVEVPDQFQQQAEDLNEQLQQTLSAPGPAFELPNFIPPDLAPPAPQQATAGDIALDAAKTKVGAMYSWGAAGPHTFDCSGLVQWAFRQAGVELPRTSFEQSHVGAPVAFQNLRPGDIVVTNGGGHVGIYAGDGKLLNAVQSGQPVSYTNLTPDEVVTARRIV